VSVQEPDDRRCSRLAVALVLLFSAGCEFDEPNGQIIVTVERDSPPVPAAGATAAIGGAPLTLTTNAAGTATFVLVPAGTKQVYASLPGYCAATASVILDDGDTDRVTLTLGSPPCPVDQIATGGGNALYALVDVRTGTSADTTCENDRFVEGHAGVAELGTNARAITWSGPCRSAAWIFSADHAPWFSNRAVDFTWTDSDGDVFNVTLPAARLRVPVTIWISDPLIDAADYRDRVLPIDLDQVNGFLHDSRSGFRLTNSINADAAPDIIDVGSLTDPRTGSPPYPIIGNACENTHAIIASPQVYRSDHINV
jgi:hypothetical protein